MEAAGEDGLGVEREGDEDLIIASRDFIKIAESRNKSGFVEGVEAGKSQGLQEGFAAGFVSGLAVSSHWAIFRGRADAIKVHHGNLATDSEKPEQFLSMLGDKVAAAAREEDRWRERRAGADRKSYQEVEAASQEGIARDTEGVKYSLRGANAASLEGVARDTEGAKCSTTVASQEGVAMDTAAAAHTDPLRSGSGLTYSELAANMEVPSEQQEFRTRLELS